MRVVIVATYIVATEIRGLEAHPVSQPASACRVHHDPGVPSSSYRSAPPSFLAQYSCMITLFETCILLALLQHEPGGWKYRPSTSFHLWNV